MCREARAAGLLTIGYIALTTWWVLRDKAIPGGGDPGIHLNTAGTAGDLIADFDLGGLLDLGPVGTEFFYPPLVHLVGGIPPALGLAVQDWGTVAMNIVFVPMLVAGVYLTGKRVFNPLAGLLAVCFALGTPMVLSLFHVFALDAPLAGTIALTFAALLYSDRFERRRETILAGALVGIALLVKPPAALYLIGPVAVMLVGGGWRQWQNMLLGAAAVLIVAGPYYLIHLNEVLDTGQETTVGSEIGRIGTYGDRDARISYDNLTWYAWGAVNLQYYVPLLALFGAGVVMALRDFRRRGIAELLAGVAVTYLVLALFLSIRDVRYTLPLVVYVAVLGTGWITLLRRDALRAGVIAFLAAVVTANVLASVTKVPDVRVTLPGTTLELDNDPGTLTFFDDRGYFVGPPVTDDLWIRLFEAAEDEGLDSARLRIQTTGLWSEDPLAFDVVASNYGIRDPGTPPCGAIYSGVDYQGEPLLVNVAVRRIQPEGGYERWCDF
jgi:hypothetical protein